MGKRANLGGPIALIVLGLIGYFALNVREWGAFNVALVGLILAGAGVLWLVLELFSNGRSKTTTTTREQVTDPNAPGGVSTAERETTIDGN